MIAAAWSPDLLGYSETSRDGQRLLGISDVPPLHSHSGVLLDKPQILHVEVGADGKASSPQDHLSGLQNNSGKRVLTVASADQSPLAQALLHSRPAVSSLPFLGKPGAQRSPTKISQTPALPPAPLDIASVRPHYEYQLGVLAGSTCCVQVGSGS